MEVGGIRRLQQTFEGLTDLKEYKGTFRYKGYRIYIRIWGFWLKFNQYRYKWKLVCKVTIIYIEY